MSDRPLAFRKKLLLSSATFVVLLLAVELGSIVIYPLLGSGSYSRTRLQQELKIAVDGDVKPIAREDQKWTKSYILHPYLGFVTTPGVYRNHWELSRGDEESQVNEQGFMGPDPVTRKSPDRVNICLLGGSVAKHFYIDSRQTFTNALQGLGLFKGKEIVIVPLATNGYKQPQQLLALSYFLSEGAEYDLVINLDGFNEIALPFAENRPHGVYPFYPRMWDYYASRILNVEGAVQFAQLVGRTEKRRRLRETFANPLLSFPNVSLVLWKALDRRLELDIRRTMASLQKLTGESNQQSTARNFESGGPSVPKYSNDAEFFSKQAEHWAKSSMQLNRLGASEGFAYFHFLQPNQYLENSKPLSREEQARAIAPRESSPFRVAVEGGYPFLIEHGKTLAANGVQFTDLTGMFRGNSTTLYEDDCCHVNKAGNDLIAAKIAAIVAEHYRSAPMK